MIRSQRILLKPTPQQAKQFERSAGLARFAWNWALAIRERHWRWFGKREGYRRPTAISLNNLWRRIRRFKFPWTYELSNRIPGDCFRKLDFAYHAAFRRMKAGSEAGFPKFHKKRDESSFMVVPGKSTPMRLSGTRFQIPKIGFVKTQSKLRWPGATQTYGRVKRVAGRWWLTLSYELPDPPKLPDGRPACGIDLGISRLATIASGGRVVEEVKSPSPYMKAQEQLRQAKRRANRKSRGSANQRKALLKLAKLHERVASVRGNFLHQLTNRLVNRFGVICLEDLRVGELAGKGLGKLIHDMGWGIIRRQIEYKAETAGTKVVFADRFYPSSKTCSTCGQVKTKLALAERNWTCEGCGTSHNRDVNAAINLEKLGRGTPEETPAETRSTPKRKLSCSRSRKQETPCSQERQAGEMPTSGLPPMTPTP